LKVKKISDYLNDSLICFLQAGQRDDALNAMTQVLYQAKKIQDRRAFYHAILQREKIVSTGIGLGVAIPHAKMPSMNDFSICVGIQKQEGLSWSAIDGHPVKLIFMVAGPDNRQTEYLQILSKLTSMIKDESLRRKLLHVKTAEEGLELLSIY
jgi:nitrogen PTS system EIIA component